MYAGRGSYLLFSGILTAFRLYRLGNLCTVQCALAAGNIEVAGILKLWEIPRNILENKLRLQLLNAFFFKFLGALQLA